MKEKPTQIRSSVSGLSSASTQEPSELQSMVNTKWDCQLSEARHSLMCISEQLPQLNGIERLRLHLQRKAEAPTKRHRPIFLTGWEEEMYNDRMGIYKPNPITDFIIEEPGKQRITARKRQKIANIPPLQASDLKRQGNVDP